MAQAVNCLPLTSEVWIRGGQSGTGTGFSPSTSISPRRCHSINAPHSSLSTSYCYEKDKRGKPGKSIFTSHFVFKCLIPQAMVL